MGLSVSLSQCICRSNQQRQRRGVGEGRREKTIIIISPSDGRDYSLFKGSPEGRDRTVPLPKEWTAVPLEGSA